MDKTSVEQEQGNGISVVINTYNASCHLQQVLDTVKGFDEVVVCDMESTDDTLDIAKRNGCKIVVFPRGNYQICEPARQTAIDAASCKWVLVVDADELVTPELKEYLYSLIEKENAPQGLYLPRKSRFMGRFMHCFYPDYQLRFFIRKDTVWPAIIHADPVIKGRIEKIPAAHADMALVHLADDSIASRMGKINQYTANEIEKKRKIAIMEWQLCSIVRWCVSSVLIFRRVASVMVRKDLYVPAMKASISLLLSARL